MILTKDILYNKNDIIQIINLINNHTITDYNTIYLNIFENIIHFNNLEYIEDILYKILFNYNKFNYLIKNIDKISIVQIKHNILQSILILNIYNNDNNYILINKNETDNENIKNHINNSKITINSAELVYNILKNNICSLSDYNYLYKNKNIFTIFNFFNNKCNKYLQQIYKYFIINDNYLATFKIFNYSLLCNNYITYNNKINKINILDSKIISYLLLMN